MIAELNKNIKIITANTKCKLEIGVQDKAASGESRKIFGLYPQYCDILGVH